MTQQKNEVEAEGSENDGDNCSNSAAATAATSEKIASALAVEDMELHEEKARRSRILKQRERCRKGKGEEKTADVQKCRTTAAVSETMH